MEVCFTHPTDLFILRFNNRQFLTDFENLVESNYFFHEDSIYRGGQIDRNAAAKHFQNRLALSYRSAPLDKPRTHGDRLILDTQIRHCKFVLRHEIKNPPGTSAEAKLTSSLPTVHY